MANEWRITEYMKKYNYENIFICNDNATGLRAVIAIHDTTLGPAAGGCRMWTYSTEWDAIEDALRLARAMTYKYAAAGVDLGGGKAVIMGDPKKEKSEALFRALGRFIDRLGGLYYTGEDVGTTLRDMEYIYSETRFVITLPEYLGGAGPIAGATATGVIQGMKVAAKKVFGSESLNGLRIGVQGLGAVGSELIKLLSKEGVKLVITDIDKERVEKALKEVNAETIAPEQIYDADVDVFSPCALGGVINNNTIPRLKCKIIAGCANNQLGTEADGYGVEKRGIVYVPDYILNAGGAIYDSDRLFHPPHNHVRAMEKVYRIRETVERVFEIAEQNHIPSFRAADVLAEKRIEEVACLLYTSPSPRD